MINSISLEKDRFDAMLPIIIAQPCQVVALCMTETAMPVTIEDGVQAGAELINRLTATFDQQMSVTELGKQSSL